MLGFLFRIISTVKKYFCISTAMDDKDAREMSVKDEQKHSPTYQPTSRYADDVYTPATHLSAEYLPNGDERQRHDLLRQYQRMSTHANHTVMDYGKGEKNAIIPTVSTKYCIFKFINISILILKY